MARRAALVPLFSSALALGCSAPDEAFPGPGATGDAHMRATTDQSEFGATVEFAPTTTDPDLGPATCGDGQLDPGEACDHGPGNADHRACTDACQLALCGDGLVQAGVEQCDLGPDGDPDQCTQDCQLPSCGDGIIQGDEQCDPRVADDRDPCTADCRRPICGDGVVQGDEQCDLGIAENRDDGACTVKCQLATCGDGLIHQGVEACDLGINNILSDNNNNNAPYYGGCLDTCALAPHCGDMIVQPEHEECDDGLDNGAGLSTPDGAACDVGCQRAARLVFITGVAHQADLGGLDGADLKCQLAAKDAGLADWLSYRAWLSDDTGSPLTRFVPGPGVPYVLLNGLRVADDLEHLLTDGPLRGIDVTETGELVPPQRPVWSNTSFTGAPHDPDAHCARWSSSAPTQQPVRIGMASAPPAALQQWRDLRYYTTWDHSACAGAWRLYCFEQALP